MSFIVATLQKSLEVGSITNPSSLVLGYYLFHRETSLETDEISYSVAVFDAKSSLVGGGNWDSRPY